MYFHAFVMKKSSNFLMLSGHGDEFWEFFEQPSLGFMNKVYFRSGFMGKNFSDFELAWTSFDKVSKAINLESYGFNHSDRKNTGQGTIHPTQKPVDLYRHLLRTYAKPGQRILDTHGGSMSIAIACHIEGFDLDVVELDKDYFEQAVKRFRLNTAQETFNF